MGKLVEPEEGKGGKSYLMGDEYWSCRSALGRAEAIFISAPFIVFYFDWSSMTKHTWTQLAKSCHRVIEQRVVLVQICLQVQ